MKNPLNGKLLTHEHPLMIELEKKITMQKIRWAKRTGQMWFQFRNENTATFR